MRQLTVRFPAAVALFVTALAGGAASAGEEISGSWKITVTREGNSREYFVELERIGDRLRGLFLSPRSGKYPFDGGAIKDGKLEFTVPRRFGDQVRRFTFKCRRAEDGSYKGIVEVGGQEVAEAVLERRGHSPLGAWNVTTSSPNGDQTYESRLIVDVERDGTYKGVSHSQLGETPVRNLTVKGNAFSFEITLDIQGTPIDFVVEAKFDGARKLAGRWYAKEDRNVSGEWRAEKEAKAPPPVARAERPEASPAERREPPVTRKLTGRWRARTELPTGETLRFTVKLREGKEGLEGELVFPQGPTPIRRFRGGPEGFEFDIDVEREGQIYRVHIEGKLEGGELRGRWSTDDGAGGDWRAKKPVVL